MSKIVAITGWGQAHDALKNVVPEGSTHVDYSQHSSAADFFRTLKNLSPDIIVGWSLGGQLALRAISEDFITAKALVLLATPYQFVANKEIKCAMNVDNFNSFHNNFTSDPVRTLKRFMTLISVNDSNAHDVLAHLRQNTNTEHASRWLYWLEELESFSCNSVDFSKMPKTIIIHGADDTVVDITQTSLFMPLIMQHSLEVFKKCGHAPHLHDEARVREIISSLA